MKNVLPLLVLASCTPMMGRLGLSAPASQATLPPIDVGDTATFVVLGDFGLHEDGRIPARSAAVLDQIDTVCADCDFVLLPGDNLYPNGVPSNGDTAFLDALADRVDVPLYLVLGNHDWGAYIWPVGGANKRRVKRQLAWVETRDDVHGHTHFWSAQAGPVHLLALDSTYVVRRCNEALVCRGQGLLEALSSLTQPETSAWTVLAAHHAYLSDGDHGDAGSFVDSPPFNLGRGESWKAAVEALEPDLLVSGHDHHLQLIEHDDRLLAISASGAKSRTVDTETRPSLFASTDPGFALVRATADQLTVEMHTASRCVAANQKRGEPPKPAKCGAG